MACRNPFSNCGCRQMCGGCGRRNNMYGGGFGCGQRAAAGRWTQNGCGCRKTGSFVDYMPVVVDYAVTPGDYNVTGAPRGGEYLPVRLAGGNGRCGCGR